MFFFSTQDPTFDLFWTSSFRISRKPTFDLLSPISIFRFSNSVLTLYGLISAPLLNLSSRSWFWVLTAQLSPNFALKWSFKLRFSPNSKMGAYINSKIGA